MPSASRISLPRNITNAHTLEELKMQLAEFVSRLEDYLNIQVGIHFLDKNTQRPTLLPGDLVFDFTDHPEFVTLQQWNGQKLVPLALSSFGGFIDLVAQGIGSGTDASLFLRSDGAGHWVLAAGPVGPPGGPGMDGDDGSVWYNGVGAPGGGLGIDGDYYLNTSNGDVYVKAAGAWSVILNIIGPAVDGAPGPGVIVGTGNPGAGIGVDDQLYINTQTGDIWVKETGTWNLYGANAYRIQGKAIDPTATTTSPTNGDVLTYDSSLFAGVGGWKAAAVGSSSFAGMDDEIRARLNLAIL